MQSASKRCRDCGDEKPLDLFYKHATADGRRSECKDCTADRHRYRQFGVTRADYEQMLVDQRGACAVCNAKLNSSRYTKLAVDHNHTTGDVRGLLCTNCNTAIGLMKESSARLIAAADYLTRHNLK